MIIFVLYRVMKIHNVFQTELQEIQLAKIKRQIYPKNLSHKTQLLSSNALSMSDQNNKFGKKLIERTLERSVICLSTKTNQSYLFRLINFVLRLGELKIYLKF